jgi:uncharacterized protein
MNKLESLKGWFSDKNGAIVALSGGVDSALVAYAAYHTLGNAALAVTADYKTLAQEELESAARICKEIGIRHVIITYDELENEDFVKTGASTAGRSCPHTSGTYHEKREST